MTFSTLIIIGLIVYVIFFSKLGKNFRAENAKEKLDVNYNSQKSESTIVPDKEVKKESFFEKNERIRKETENNYAELVEEKFREEKLNITKKLFTKNDSVIGFDDTRKKVCFLENKAILYKKDLSTVKFISETYDYRDIFEAEVIIDGETIIKTSRTSQIGGIIVGGALLGGVGAVVGGLSGNKSSRQKTEKIQLKIILNNISAPLKEITFLDEAKGVDHKNEKYIKAYKQVMEAHSLFKVVLKQADRETLVKSMVDNGEVETPFIKPSEESNILSGIGTKKAGTKISNEPLTNNELNIEEEEQVVKSEATTNFYGRADEIKKLYNLMEENIITREEFEELKKKLI